MDLIFADDSRQNKPSRPGMGPLVAIGGIHVPSDRVRSLEIAIDECCSKYEFPDEQEFKWSPGRDMWMYKCLVGEVRRSFFLHVLGLLAEHGAQALVVMEDQDKDTATDAETAEEDVSRLFLERVDSQLHHADCEGVVIVDRPGGGRKEEDRYLASCLETLVSGTRYVDFDHIALNVISTSSHLVRLLQAADVIVGCATAYVSGEDRYSPPVFKEGIMSLLCKDRGRTGGVGLKLHPDFRYANLYHWLLGDKHLIRYSIGAPLPMSNRPYSKGPLCP